MPDPFCDKPDFPQLSSNVRGAVHKSFDLIPWLELIFRAVSPEKPPKSSPEEEAGKKDHYSAILLEEVRDQFKFVIAKVDGMEGSLKKEMTENKAELKQDIADMGKALTMRIDNVRTELKQEIQGVRTELSEKISAVDTKLTAVSSKLDKTHEIVLRHDQDIAHLKKTA